VKIYEAWDELKNELIKFLVSGDGEIKGGDDVDSDDAIVTEVLYLIDYLEMKHE
jgi:hypothetical protein